MKVGASDKSNFIGIDPAGVLRYLKATSERIANVTPGRLLHPLLSIEFEGREFICRGEHRVRFRLSGTRNLNQGLIGSTPLRIGAIDGTICAVEAIEHQSIAEVRLMRNRDHLITLLAAPPEIRP